MRNCGRILLAFAVVAVSSQVSFGQSFRDAGSKITGNYNGVYSTNRTYRSYSYRAPSTTVTQAPAVVNSAPATVVAPAAPSAVAAAPAPTPAPSAAAVAPAPKAAVVNPPAVTQQAQNQVRTQRTYSYQPQYQGNNGYRSMRSNTYDPAFRRADAKILGH